VVPKTSKHSTQHRGFTPRASGRTTKAIKFCVSNGQQQFHSWWCTDTESVEFLLCCWIQWHQCHLLSVSAGGNCDLRPHPCWSLGMEDPEEVQRCVSFSNFFHLQFTPTESSPATHCDSIIIPSFSNNSKKTHDTRRNWLSGLSFSVIIAISRLLYSTYFVLLSPQLPTYCPFKKYKQKKQKYK
jgi:hypothetical protein